MSLSADSEKLETVAHKTSHYFTVSEVCHSYMKFVFDVFNLHESFLFCV
jgi:hypothetical protein